jgi:4-oxalocrotonate tautomerase
MSLVRISLLHGSSAAYRRAIADGVHQAIVELAAVPEFDRFQVITEHTAESLICDPIYLDIGRTDDMVFIQIPLNAWCSAIQKRRLCGRVLELLARDVGVRPQDVLISLREACRENRSPGKRGAQ